MVLADRNADTVFYEGVEKALAVPGVDVRIFGKRRARPYRRMAVCLALAETLDEAKKNALRASETVRLRYGD